MTEEQSIQLGLSCERAAVKWRSGRSAEDAYELCSKIIDAYNELEKPHKLVITRTGDDEVLLYTNRDNGLSNLIIDEDLDVSWIFLNRDPKMPYMEPKFFGSNIDTKMLAELL